MDRFVVSDASVLAFAPHIVFRFDDTRSRWIIMAPERLMLPDEQAVEILQLVDGSAGVGTIVDSLVQRYTQAPRELIDIAVRAARPIGDGFYGVDVKQTDHGFVVMEVNDNPNLEHGIEDQVGKDEIWTRLLRWFIERFEQ